ncbi:MAG: hypothetical protein R3B07_32095 [Polyangiaceae bacterium]
MTWRYAITVFASALALSACSSEVITLAEGVGGSGALPGGNGGAGGSYAGAGGSYAGAGGSYAGAGGAASGGTASGGAATGGGAAPGGNAGTGVGGGGLAGVAGSGGYAGAGGSAGGGFCTPSSGCGGSMYCEPDGCGTLTGSCQPLDPACDGTFEPSCGCDGLTYWNPCVRAWAGVAEQHPGECDPGLAQKCSDSEPCSEPYATCVSIEPSCQAAECWVMPCPSVPPQLLVGTCDGSQSCVDVCAVAPGTAVVLGAGCQ